MSEPLASATLTDADDSIVLSDLVRSGEASRLRRRGAIAIRDTSSSSASMNNSASSPLPRSQLASQSHRAPPLVVLPAPDDPDEYEYDDGDDDDDDDFVGVWTWGRRNADSAELLERDSRRISLEAEMHLEETDQSAGVYALFCGGFDHADVEPHAPAETQNPPPRRRASAFCPASPPPRPVPRRTNGCGTLVHFNAIPRRQHGVWIARGPATDSVVGLDAEYFDGRAVAKMMENGCGCVRKGVGCRVCGNPLGTIYVPCKTAVDGIFGTPSPSPSPSPPSTTSTFRRPSSSTAPPRQPSGPAYWLPRSQAPSPRPRSQLQSQPPHAVFTFFATSVRSSPSFTFPPPAPPPHHAHPPTPQPGSPPVPQRRWPEYPITRQSVVWGEPQVYESEERSRDRDDSMDEDGDGDDLPLEGEVEGAEKVETAATVWADR